MKQLIFLLFAVLLALPFQRTVSAAGMQQRSTPTPTPAPEEDVSGGLGSRAEAQGPAFYWLETEFLTALLPTEWSTQESEVDEAEGTFTVMAAAAEDLADIEEQGVLLVVQATNTAVDPNEVLDSFQLPSEECSAGERSKVTHVFSGRTYTSVYDVWQSCPSEDMNLYVLTVQSEDLDAALFGVFFAPTEMADLSFDIFRNTLSIVDVPPLDAPVRPTTPPTRVPEQTPTPTSTPEPPASREDTATVTAARLNVRSGPGTSYAVISAVGAGDELTIVGRNADCSWINIVTPDEVTGWVAGGPQYVTFEADCSDIPTVEVPPTPTPLPATATPVSAAPTPVPPPAAEATEPPNNAATDDMGLDPALGCFLFENQLGSEITITFTRSSDSWNVTFVLPRGESDVRCFDPGNYTYTLDAPPPWNSVNGDMRITAGERTLFPIRGR